MYLLNADFVTAIFHSDVCELLSDQWQRLLVPKLGEQSIVPLA